MFRSLFLSTMLMAGLALSATAIAEDHAQPDSVWEGTAKTFNRIDGKPQINTYDCRLTILTREGAKFTGEYWWNKDERGIAIEGKIEKGGMRFTATKELAGKGLDDLVGNTRVAGRFRGKEMKELQLKFTVPGTQARSGEIVVRLKD
jgi:hypothetical protein